MKKNVENIWQFAKKSLPLHSLSGRNARNNNVMPNVTHGTKVKNNDTK